MFLDMLIKRNPALVQAAFALHRAGQVDPNSYIIDLDTLRQNAVKIHEAARRMGLSVFAMTKQIGRNPIACKAIAESGIAEFAAVDPWEALRLAKAGFRLGNAGHLVQIPVGMLRRVLSCAPRFVTVYSLDNAALVNAEAKILGITQRLMLRIACKTAAYPGQEGGVALEDLERVSREIKKFQNVILAGVTSFPCVLFDPKTERFQLTAAAVELQEAVKLLTAEGWALEAVNMPSANACGSMELVRQAGGNYIEPGHAFTGTTPAHAVSEQPELPCILYLSEVSHKDDNTACVYGGGRYARSNMTFALAGGDEASLMSARYKFHFPPDDHIDYYGKLSDSRGLRVGDTVIAAFRAQIFVSRAHVAAVSGVQSGKPVVEGVFDALGNREI